VPKKRVLPDWVITKGQLSRRQWEQRRKRQFTIAAAVIIVIVVALVATAVYQATRPDLVALAIAPRVPSVEPGQTLQLTATGIYDDGRQKDLTHKVTWTSSDPAVATIGPDTGLAKGLADGSTTISATKGDVSVATLLGVVPPALLKVNQATYDMEYYVKMLRLRGILTISDPSSRAALAQGIWETIIDNEVCRQLAEEMGIEVSEEEIDAELVRQMGEGASQEEGEEPPTYQDIRERLVETLAKLGVTEEEYREITRTQLLADKVRDKVKAEEVPAEMPQAHVWGILVDVAPPEVSGTPAATATPEPSPALQPEQSGTEAATAPEENLAQAQRIREEILDRLAQGEDFADIAEELSKDASASDGGDLGWMPQEIAQMRYGEEFAQAAFSLEPGELSQPIPQSTSPENTRYWIVRVTEKEDSRPLEEEQRRLLESRAFSRWLSKQKEGFTIEDKLNPDLRAWAIEKALEPPEPSEGVEGQ